MLDQSKVDNFKKYIRAASVAFEQLILDRNNPNFIISGGCFKSFMNDESIKDIDIYIDDNSTYGSLSKVANKITSKSLYFDWNSVFNNPNPMQFNVILDLSPKFGSTIYEKFDFYHTMWSYSRQTDQFMVNKNETLHCIEHNILKLRETYIISTHTIARYKKFLKRGMIFDIETYQRILAWSHSTGINYDSIKEEGAES